MKHSLREKCLYSEIFWSVISRIQTEYGEIQSISPYFFRMRENMDLKNCEYGHFSRSGWRVHLTDFHSKKSGAFERS